MSISFSFDEKNISVVLDEKNLQISNSEQNVQLNLENQFKIEDLSDKTLVKILMLKGEKGDAGATTGASWGYITGNITDQTDLKNALNSKANKNELSTVATSGSYTDLSNKPTIPSKTSDLTNDSGFIDNSYHDNTKQDTLVSGTNIKTINNTSLLGSGNITIEGGGGTATDVQINGTSITSNDVANIITEGTYNASTNKIATKSDIPTKTSDLTNDSGFAKIYYVSKEQNNYTYNQIVGLLNNGYEIHLRYDDYYVGTIKPIFTLSSYNTYYMYFTDVNGASVTTYTYNFDNNVWSRSTDYLVTDDIYDDIPTKTSDLTNDSGFITSYTETDPIFTSSVAHGITSTDITNWNNKSTFSGNYNDLTNKPTIPIATSDLSNDGDGTGGLQYALTNEVSGNAGNGVAVNYDSINDIYAVTPIYDGVEIQDDLAFKSDIPTNTSDLTNDSGFIDSSYHDSTKQDEITSTNKLDYSLIDNTPTIPTVPTTVSSFTNDAGYITGITSSDVTTALGYTPEEEITVLNDTDLTNINSTSDTTFIKLKDLIDNNKPFCVYSEDYVVSSSTTTNWYGTAFDTYKRSDGNTTTYSFCYYNHDTSGGAVFEYRFEVSGTSVTTTIIGHPKQDELVSGTNIKTINNNSILGSGNLDLTLRYVTFALSSTQSIAKSTFTKINYDTTEREGTSFASISSGTITFSEGGSYLLIMNTIFDTNNTGGRYQDAFKGSAGYCLASSTGATGVRTALNSSAIVSFNANDTFYCRAYQTTSGNLNLIGGSRITIIKIR